jgi:16S rRNA (cytosine967-C5)-methyltransferase
MHVDEPRRAAYDLLYEVGVEDAYANLVMPQILAHYELSGRDAAFATELGFGSLRQRGFIDAVLAKCVDRELLRIEPPVLDVLRLGAYQLLFMRVPSHAAVATSVELVKRVTRNNASGLVNAVLRKVAARDKDNWTNAVASGKDEIERLAATLSHPAWQVRALADALGSARAELPRLLDIDNLPPSVTLVARPGACDVEELLDMSKAEVGKWSPYAVRISGIAPGDVPAVVDGRAAVQDEGSQLVALALAHAPIEGSDSQWLDLCAGPGGKAGLLAALAHARGGSLTAVELQPHRADLVRKTLRGVPGAHDVRVADGRTVTGSFDRVLVDAPCTGLGVLRRRPESRWRREPGHIGELTPLQKELLLTAIACTRPGGVIAYVTCSPHLAETELVVDAVLKAGHVDRLDAREVALTIPGLRNRDEFGACTEPGPYLRLWPHRHDTDGMFLALLRRR